MSVHVASSVVSEVAKTFGKPIYPAYVRVTKQLESAIILQMFTGWPEGWGMGWTGTTDHPVTAILDDIAYESGLTLRETIRGLKRLKRMGILRIITSDEVWCDTAYQLDMPKLQEALKKATNERI